MNDLEKIDFIKILFEGYYNTDQDTEVFAKEFYEVVGNILLGNAPISLEHLSNFKSYVISKSPKLAKLYGCAE